MEDNLSFIRKCLGFLLKDDSDGKEEDKEAGEKVVETTGEEVQGDGTKPGTKAPTQ